jgi:hypothetical protein
MVSKQIYTTDKELLVQVLSKMSYQDIMQLASENHYTDVRDKVRMKNRYGDIEIGSNAEKERVQMRNPIGRNRKWTVESIVRDVIKEFIV